MTCSVRRCVILLTLLAWLPVWVSDLTWGENTWSDFGELARKVEPIAPTPIGEGHLGLLASGACVQARFPVPKQKPLAYRVGLGNVVAYSGKGSFYQLLVRRDSEKGDLLFEGTPVPGGDDWNNNNQNPIDLLKYLTEADCQKGYLDLSVCATVKDDGWTLYRHDPKARAMYAEIVEATDQVRRTLQATEDMRKRGIALLPMPQALDLREGSVRLSRNSRIVLEGATTPADRFAAQDLAEQLYDRGHLRPKIVTGVPAKPGDIILRRVGTGELAESKPDMTSSFPSDCAWDQAYRLIVTDRAIVTAAGDPGLFYGAQTVAQMTNASAQIPRCALSDWPAYPLRGIQWDVARGQTVNVEFWRYALRELGRCKLNAIMIYGENDYRFQQYPFLGRPDTFTPEKARELSDFAERYHVQLIPQFESLGHADAVLQHEELKDVREGGQAWVFCTSNPKTWEFLDKVYGEFAEQFPNSRYIHIGGDEFEDGFGVCDRCRERVKEIGIGGLYAEHMNKLNALVKKRGRTMLFWPSHGASTPERSYLTLRFADKMDRDCIPTEWIYHGPMSYPEIKQYQEAGFKDVWTSPAVVCYSIIYPDYPTTYRGIRGFLRAGNERGVKGTCTTTWEFMQGALYENSWLGLLYATECGWSLGRTPRTDFERRFAERWLGVMGADAADRIADTLAEPWPSGGLGGICRSGMMMRDLFWSDPKRVRREFVMKQGLKPEQSQAIADAGQAALERLSSLRSRAHRNLRELDATELAFRMYRHAGQKLKTIDEATGLYQAASQSSPQDRVATLGTIGARVAELGRECGYFIKTYGRMVKECGAYHGDLDRLSNLSASYEGLAKDLANLAEQVKEGKVGQLPPGSQFGFDAGAYVKIGGWAPSQMNETACGIRLDITGYLKGNGPFSIEWEYTGGQHGVSLSETTLLVNDKPLSTDSHGGWTGSGSHNNAYTLELKEYDPKAKYEIAGKMKSAGGTDSSGNVWLILSGKD